MIYDIYCKWVSTQWQRSVNLYKNGRETAVYRRINNTQNNTIARYTPNRKQIYETKETNIICILKNINRVIRK